ncbi:TPA: ABC transporter permease [Candidatus Bathyarchaeota archaeon]|nr:ABC transporter permease [Candidatus Bathyarchaeota archaeon]
MLKVGLRRRSVPSHPLLPLALSLGLSLLVCGALFWSVGADPLLGYLKMFEGAFVRASGISETLTRSIPIMLCGLSVTLALRAGFWNIGAEGQMYAGAIAATALALALPEAPAYSLLPAMLVAGFSSGALWGLITVPLKVRLNVSEILTTLMMNYIAVLITSDLVHGSWSDRYGFPQTELFAESARLPRIPGTRIHVTLFIGLVGALLIFVLLRRTTLGYEIRVLGEGLEASRYAGINRFRVLLVVMAISGGLAGIAGMGEVSGALRQLRYDFSPGYGYTGILIAFLSKLNPIAVVVSAVLIGGLFVGVDMIQITLGLPAAMANVFQGLIFLFFLGCEVLSRYRVVIRVRG